MPCYPAIALLLACAIASTNAWISKARHLGDKAFSAICVGAAGAISFLLARVWTLPAPGDISQALAQHPEEYTLSLGHMGDLTLSSFAYLKGPLMLAGGAVLVGLAGVLLLRESRRYLAPVLMMILFFHAARFAMVTFDPYLSSKQLADALRKSPQGELIVDDQYYTFASVFFYADRDALLLNGRVNNLEYGSNAPGAPNVFITDAQLPLLWDQNRRWYLVAERPGFQRIEKLLGEARIFVVRESGGKYLITNQPITENASLKARYFSGRNRDLRRDVTVAHGNGAVGISGRFRIVRNHQNGLSALLIYVL